MINEQNLVAPAGQVGQPPAKAGTQFQYSVNVKGRLTDPAEFENMIVRTLPDGSILRMKDVSRAELSGKSYTSFGRKDGIPATLVIIYQLPGANAIQTVDNSAKLLDGSQQELSAGAAVSNLARYHRVRARWPSTKLFLALRDAIILVLIVVFIFLGNFRATFIPMLAVPVSLVGTFAAFVALGFSINTLTMLAVVLAVGIVVDDAIVVVEAVEHHIEHGLTPAGGHGEGHGRGQRTGGRHRPGAVRRVRAGLVHGRHRRPAVQAVRDHHFGFGDPLGRSWP